ncbi:dTDP-glucose 4,6-dehydratase [Clostridiaceae bacterium JG1575]|nr:dTDP-glucose 4,6-dehydratase [Clostridiaceae bacterium JG1575]
MDCRTILVTGGAGFIGSNFIHYLIETYGDQVEIINFDALTYAGNLENLKEVEDLANYRFEKGDITSSKEVARMFETYDVDLVVHMAAESHVDRSILDPEVFIRTNVLGTYNLLMAAKRAWEVGPKTYAAGKRFVHVSTDEVYGSLADDGSFFTETTPLDPHSPYSASKASSDLFVKAFGDTYGFPFCITRCSNNYGPYQFPEKLIPLMIHNALKGLPLPVYGKGENIRDWLYVADHCKAIDLVSREGRLGEVYNIGGHNELRNIDLVKSILQKVREALPEGDPRAETITEGLIRYVADRPGHDLRYAISPQKIHQELSWLPETCFDQGIERTIQWYLENLSWMEHITSGAYEAYYDAMYQHRGVTADKTQEPQSLLKA